MASGHSQPFKGNEEVTQKNRQGNSLLKETENNLNVNLQETNLVNYDIPTPKHAETRKNNEAYLNC